MEIRILQFGEGNFLRAFIDWMVQRMIGRGLFDGAVAVVQPRRTELTSVSRAINAAGGRYRVALRGLEGGRTVDTVEEISCVTGVGVPADVARIALEPSLRFVVSNTTEAGIAYVKGADTFPSKVARLLKARFEAGLPGLVFLPCELVEDNGGKLRDCTLLHLADLPGGDDPALVKYVNEACVFCSTLVDRIVTGATSAAEPTLVTAEPFHFLAVETPAGYDLEAELPLRAAGLNVVYADDIAPDRARKVRLLNATHTTMVHLALEKGFAEVAEALADPEFGAFVRNVMFEEICPTVDLPEAEKRSFAESVLERFANPFAHHRLASIALNSAAKWKVRCLPVVCDHYRMFGRMPAGMMAGYDALARSLDCK